MMAGKFERWCRNTTCHGWGELLRNKTKIGKVFWAVFIIFSIAFLVEQTIMTVLKLINDDAWVTSVYEKQGSNIEFPDVIVCNMNIINRTKAIQKWGLNDSHISYILGHFNSGISFQPSMKVQQQRQREFAEWKLENAPDVRFTDLVFDLGPDCDGTFASKQFFFNNQVYYEKPCAKYVRTVQLPAFGKCLRIVPPRENSDNYSTGGVGLVNGMSFFLAMGFEHHAHGLDSIYLGAGFALFLTYNKSWPHSWVGLPPGFRSFVTLKQRKEMLGTKPSQLPLSTPPCKEPGELKLLKDRVEYSRDACDIDCYFEAAYNYCNCTPMVNIESEMEPYRPCEIDDLDFCIQPNAENIGKETTECSKNCDEACFKTSVRATTSIQRFPSPVQLSKLIDFLQPEYSFNITPNWVQNNFVAVDIFFESKAAEVVAWYEKMPLSQIVSNIGGNLGLAAGISILSIAQIFWHIFNVSTTAAPIESTKPSRIFDKRSARGESQK